MPADRVPQSARVNRGLVHERIDDLLVRLGSGHPETEQTLDQYFGPWLERRTPLLAASTADGYATMYRIYISPYLGPRPLPLITVADVGAWVTTLLASGSRQSGPLAARTVTYARVILHKAMEDAVAAGDLLINPVSRTESPHRDLTGARRRYPAASWTIEELRLFLRLIEGHRFGPLYTLLATTGMRRGEALALTWSDLDTDRNELAIHHALTFVRGQPVRDRTKTGRPRKIALGERAMDALDLQASRQQTARILAGAAWDNPIGLVFAAPDGRPQPPAQVTDDFRSLVPRLPVSRIRLHDLRHTHAILLLHAGVPVIDVSHRLGHSDPAMTLELYAHTFQNPGHSVAEAFDRLLDNKMWHADDGGRTRL